jgi:hypothetical protein
MPKPKPTKNDEELSGLFGHTYVPDPELDDKVIRYQFEILRRLGHDRWIVQLFSWLDGDRTEVAVYPQAYLLSDDVKLYADKDAWHWAYEQEAKRLDYRRRCKQHDNNLTARGPVKVPTDG